MRSILIAPVLCVILAANAPARDMYVDNMAGDDRNSGDSASTLGAAGGPYRTIRRALRAAKAGDRIIIANTGQPYRESLSLGGARHSGFSGRPFIVEGDGAVIDGTASVPHDEWEHYEGDVFSVCASSRAVSAIVSRRQAGQPRTGFRRWSISAQVATAAVEPGGGPHLFLRRKRTAAATLRPGVRRRANGHHAVPGAPC